MTELEQYKKAYATLLGRVDGVATKLMNEAVRFDPRFEKGLMLIALELLFTLYEAENTFVDEDPEGK